MRSKTKLLNRFGPGLMLAAAAVGVSHLVHATRTGAEFGLSLTWLLVLIAIIKYPAFRFGVDYATCTKRGLVSAYAERGGLAKAWLMLALFMDMFIATAALALITAGLLLNIFHLPFTEIQIAIVVLVVSSLILVNGSYAKTEFIVKLLVGAFSILTLLATFAAVPSLGSDGRDLFGEVTMSRSLLVFIIAVAGWMPLPMTGTIFLSEWAKEKQALEPGGMDHKTAIQDLRFGWILTLLLAICFVVLGTAVLFQAGHEVPASAGAFATELFRIFTGAIGDWAYPVIVITALAVMWSSLFAILDAMPRVTSRLFNKNSYSGFLILQIVGTIALLLFLMKSFGAFITFATSVGFITAPAIAYYNYRAVTSEGISSQYRPSKSLVLWHWVGMAVLILFAAAFVIERLV